MRFDSGEVNFESIYFVNDYDNLVGTVTDSTGGGGQIGDQFDGGKVVVSGLEVSTGYYVVSERFTFPFSLRYTWTNKAEFKNAFDSNFDPWGQVEIGDELPYIPEHQLHVAAGLEGERFNVSLAANFVGRMRSKAGQGAFLPGETVDSHVVVDLVGAFRISENLATYVKVDNLLDETYIAARRPAGVRPGLPRTAYIGLTYRL